MRPYAIILASALSVSAAAQPPLAGEWVGGTDVLGSWRFTQARFSTQGESSLDVPGVNAMRMPVESLTTANGAVRFSVRSPLGRLSFSGRFEGDMLRGMLTSYDGRKGTLHLVPRADMPRASYDGAVGTYALNNGQRLVVTYRPFGQLFAVALEGSDEAPVIKRQLNLIPGGVDWFFTSGSVNAAPKRDEIVRFSRRPDGQRTMSWGLPGGPTLTGDAIANEVRQEWVTIQNGGVTLNATLFLPPGVGPFPALVSVGGSGPTTRDGVIVRTRELVRAGLAVLVYDKRGTGDPSGGPFSTATFADLASDASAARAYLATRKEVDATRIGFHGHSQGGWVIPIAALQEPRPRFVILTSTPSMGPAEQEGYRAAAQARTAKLNDVDASASADLMRRKWGVARDPGTWAAYESALKAATGAPWLQIVSAPTSSDAPAWADMRALLATPPQRDAFAQAEIPTLMLYGALDDEVPPRVSADGWRAAFGTAYSSQLDVTEFPGAGHGLFAMTAPEGTKVRPDVGKRIRDWLATRGLITAR